MAKKQINIQELFSKLTGHFESDKKLLIDAVHQMRHDGTSGLICTQVGFKLYALLLENGLNESDVLNPDRLSEKVETFYHNNQPQTALDLLEVLDAIEPYQKYGPEGGKVYCFENEIELRIFQSLAKINSDFTWIESNRPNFLARKAKILIELGRTKEAKAVLDELLDINPFSFYAHLLKAKIEQNKSASKFLQLLRTAQDHAYAPDHFLQLLANFTQSFMQSGDDVGTYLTLSAITLFDDSEELHDEIKFWEQKLTRTVVKSVKVPAEAIEILNFLDKNNIRFYPTDRIYNILLEVLEEEMLKSEITQKRGQLEHAIIVFGGKKDLELLKHKVRVKK